MCYVKKIFIVLCYVLLCENRNFSCYVMLCVMISIFALEHGIFTVNIWKSAFKFIKKVTFRKVCTVYGPGKKFVLLYSLGVKSKVDGPGG